MSGAKVDAVDLAGWLARNREKLGSEYEVRFVEDVLARVPGLDPRALSAQFPFRDAEGRQRYCDFVIQEGDDLRIAIEVDGYDKRGTGQGMSRADFLDWQRRQAALVSQGWRVLRFANVDVRDQPAACAEHVTLLLRMERSKASHQQGLRARIRALKAAQQTVASDRRVAEARATYAVGLDRSADELRHLRASLEAAQHAALLSESERRRLDSLEQHQRRAQALVKETNIMKTTIWALTVLMAVLLVLLFGNRSPADRTAVAPASAFRAGSDAVAADDTADYAGVAAGTPAGAELTAAAVGPAGASAADPALAREPVSAPVQTQTVEAAPASVPAASSTQAPMQAPPTVPVESAAAAVQPAPVPAGASCSNPLAWQEAGNHVGATVALAGPVVHTSVRDDVRGRPVFITVGQAFPARQRLDLVIWQDARYRFESVLEAGLEGRDACVLGEVGMREGIPRIVLKQPLQLQVH